MSKQHVDRIRVPNPFVEGRTCVYVIRTDPVTMIDTGIATDRAYDALLEGLKDIGLSPSDIKRIILTHKHIDHIGSAWRFQQECGTEIMIHESETASVSDVDPTGERYADLVRGRLEEWQIPQEARPDTKELSGPQWKIESADASPLVDGQKIPVADGEIEVLHTPGHTMGSICLRFGGYLFSGDHVLPDISPNVGGGDMRKRGLLPHYLNSLARVRDVCRDEKLQVMPGHGDPMESVSERCDELIRHHEDRLEQVVAILRRDGELTAYEVARRLFGTMESFHVLLGCAEAQSHLELLIDQGRVAHQAGKYAAM